MRKIDAHAHGGYFGSWCDVGLTAQEMLCAMREYSIEKSLISYPDNSVTKEAMQSCPDSFVGLAWMDPHQGGKALAEFCSLVDEEHFSGLKLHPLFNAYTANDSVVFPLIEQAQKRDLPVFIHSG
ncbi:MAG: amidohydrolase family protein, partial [Deltaproteobacteria bacterium]|nr:amidohydrolase family protein [Deltaproteobacteria bacterium]